MTVVPPDGTRRRERRRVSLTSKTASQRWGEACERELLVHGAPKPRKEVPTLEEFARRFLDGHSRANRQKPSGIAAKDTILRVHLVRARRAARVDPIVAHREE